MRQKLANNYDAAIDLFDYCHQLDPESGAVLYELAELYRYAKNECPIYIIDPKEVPVRDKRVTHIRETATVGMERFLELLGA